MTYDEALRAMDYDNWVNLDESARVEVLQCVEEHSALDAGREPRTVIAEWLETSDEAVCMGKYDRDRNVIVLNSSQLLPDSLHGKTHDRMTETTLHEGRHAFQWDCVEGKAQHNNPRQVREWTANLTEEGYIRPKENLRAYINQPVEKDAREFAKAKLAEIEAERVAIIRNQSQSVHRDARTTFKSQILVTDMGRGHSSGMKASRAAFASQSGVRGEMHASPLSPSFAARESANGVADTHGEAQSGGMTQ